MALSPTLRPWPASARYRAAAALPVLRRGGGPAGHAVRRVLEPPDLHRPTLLRLLRRAVRHLDTGGVRRDRPVWTLRREGAAFRQRPLRPELRRRQPADD